MESVVSIEFCLMCNYAPKAAQTAEALFNHFRRNISRLELIAGSGGAFEVSLNGNKVYSKLETKQFPDIEQRGYGESPQYRKQLTLSEVNAFDEFDDRTTRRNVRG